MAGRRLSSFSLTCGSQQLAMQQEEQQKDVSTCIV
jgi:hypothetical protein